MFTDTHRTCSVCGETKPHSEYPPHKQNGTSQSKCRPCTNAYIKELYRADPVRAMLRRAKARAKKRGLEFRLTPADIGDLPKTCPALGIPLKTSGGTLEDGAYSLDRIDSNAGYVPGNVAVISYLANRLKNNGTSDQLRAIADWMDTIAS